MTGRSTAVAAPLSDLTPTASPRHFFGAELRFYRLRAGLSQYALAPRVLSSAAMLGKIENATRYPTLDLAERCDVVLECGGALVRLFGLLDAHREALKPHDDVAALMARFMRAVAGIPELATRGAVAATPGVLDRIDAVLIHTALNDEFAATTKRRTPTRKPSA